MNKIRIIDLLNKIANGECFKAKSKTMIINSRDGKGVSIGYLTKSLNNGSDLYLIQHLNDEVEIIEEDKKIYKLDWVEGNTFNKIQENSYLSRKEIQLLDSNFKELRNKINEIIDKLNEGDKQ